jgi:hypothetical protein
VGVRVSPEAPVQDGNMSATISGNIGGSNFSGATVQLNGITSNGATQSFACCDANGNYTFSGLAAGTYTVAVPPFSVSGVLQYFYNTISVTVQASDVTSGTTFANTNLFATAANAAKSYT